MCIYTCIHIYIYITHITCLACGVKRVRDWYNRRMRVSQSSKNRMRANQSIRVKRVRYWYNWRMPRHYCPPHPPHPAHSCLSIYP